MDSDVSEHLSRIARAIARLERKTDFILRQLKLEYFDDPEDGIPPQFAEVAAFLKQGNKLQAIQAYRKLTGAGIEEAKSAVEKIEMGLTPQ
jgi:hypothetical protein